MQHGQVVGCVLQRLPLLLSLLTRLGFPLLVALLGLLMCLPQTAMMSALAALRGEGCVRLVVGRIDVGALLQQLEWDLPALDVLDEAGYGLRLGLVIELVVRVPAGRGCGEWARGVGGCDLYA